MRVVRASAINEFVPVYPLCTSVRLKYRFWRFCRTVESITCDPSMGCMGSSPARLTKTIENK